MTGEEQQGRARATRPEDCEWWPSMKTLLQGCASTHHSTAAAPGSSASQATQICSTHAATPPPPQALHCMGPRRPPTHRAGQEQMVLVGLMAQGPLQHRQGADVAAAAGRHAVHAWLVLSAVTHLERLLSCGVVWQGSSNRCEGGRWQGGSRLLQVWTCRSRGGAGRDSAEGGATRSHLCDIDARRCIGPGRLVLVAVLELAPAVLDSTAWRDMGHSTAEQSRAGSGQRASQLQNLVVPPHKSAAWLHQLPTHNRTWCHTIRQPALQRICMRRSSGITWHTTQHEHHGAQGRSAASQQTHAGQATAAVARLGRTGASGAHQRARPVLEARVQHISEAAVEAAAAHGLRGALLDRPLHVQQPPQLLPLCLKRVQALGCRDNLGRREGLLRRGGWPWRRLGLPLLLLPFLLLRRLPRRCCVCRRRCRRLLLC